MQSNKQIKKDHDQAQDQQKKSRSPANKIVATSIDEGGNKVKNQSKENADKYYTNSENMLRKESEGINSPLFFKHSIPPAPKSSSRLKKTMRYIKVWGNLIFAFAVAIFAGVQCWVSYCQWETMQEQMVQDKRAWFGIYQVEKWDIVNDIGTPITTKFVNTGNSPAMKISINYGVLVTEDRNIDVGNHLIKWIKANPQIIWNDAGTGIKSGTVFPNQTMRHYTPALREKTQNEIQKIISDDMFFFLVIFTYYDDIFSNTHYTQGCFIYDVSSNTFQVHTSGNYAD